MLAGRIGEDLEHHRPAGVGCLAVKLLLTNDDGLGAPGLNALGVAAAGLGDCVTVAPIDGLSGCSHQVTTHKAIRIESRGAGQVAVDGTPADCVRLALRHLATDVSWVLSGINAGGNLGADVHISGTVAAAREAVLLGVPGIAISHYKASGRTFDWEAAARRTAPILADLISRPWEPGTLWNINLPHLEPGSPDPEVAFCPVDPCPLPVDFRFEDDRFHYVGNYHRRPRRPGTDVDVCFGGRIAVSLIRLSM